MYHSAYDAVINSRIINTVSENCDTSKKLIYVFRELHFTSPTAECRKKCSILPLGNFFETDHVGFRFSGSVRWCDIPEIRAYVIPRKLSILYVPRPSEGYSPLGESSIYERNRNDI